MDGAILLAGPIAKHLSIHVISELQITQELHPLENINKRNYDLYIKYNIIEIKLGSRVKIA